MKVPMRLMVFALLASLALALFLGNLGCERRRDTAASTAPATARASSADPDDSVSPIPVDPTKALLHCIMFRDDAGVKAVLADHPELVNKPIRGIYPLATACETRSLAVVRALVERNADLKVKTGAGWSMLWLAVISDSMPVVKYLVARGMDPKAREVDGETLLWAAQGREMAELLISFGIDPKARDSFNDTALHAACRHSRKDVVEYLLDKGVGIETRGRWNMPPLHSAASTVTGDPRPVVYLLLARGADVNSRGYQGHTALHECAFYNRVEMAELLLSRGASVDAKDDQGKTPMDLALLAGKKERPRIINLLIKHGAPGQLIPTREVQ